MPRYYRHIRQGVHLIPDPDGAELPNLDAARADALAGIRDIMASAIKRGDGDWLEDAIVITDDAGRELMIVPFVDALPTRLRTALNL